jgi:outer membrane murein-binding lipoprotein Lpp
MKRLVLPLVLSTILLAGCDSPQRTVVSLRKEITEFKAAPDQKKQGRIDQDFAKLERQIAELEQRGDPKTGEFKSQLISLRSDYQAARMAKAVQDAKNAIQGFGEALKETARGFEDALKKAEGDGE